jgi:hypothetical protein
VIDGDLRPLSAPTEAVAFACHCEHQGNGMQLSADCPPLTATKGGATSVWSFVWEVGSGGDSDQVRDTLTAL